MAFTRAAARVAPVSTFFDASAVLQRTEIDVICVASFPHLLGADLLSRAGVAVNLHPSLLPRHRGPDPLFWTYFDDDREAGVTLHHLSDRADAGDIVAQRTLPLERGEDVVTLYTHLARAAAAMTAEVLDTLVAGTASRTPQVEAHATYEQRPANPSIDFAAWPCERVWHVISGLGSRRNDLLPFAHGRALGFERTAHGSPGRIERRRGTARLSCADGYVDVATAPVAARISRTARRLLHFAVRRSQSTESSR